MACTVFNVNQLDILAQKVRKLLLTVGYHIQHEGVCGLLQSRGLKRTVSDRYVFDNTLINEFVAFQENRRRKKLEAANKASSEIKKSNSCQHAGKRKLLRAGFGNFQPKFYDYSKGVEVLANSEHVSQLVKFAHCDERIVSIGIPLSLTDVPIETSPIETFLMIAKLTDKFHGSIDPFCGEMVKYLVELSDVFRGPGQHNGFIDPCNCINPIMRLEERTAAVMYERAKYGLDNMMTSMPAAGGTAPVTLDGAAIQGAAEIVGGLIISYLLNPEVDHRGYISSSILDMKAAVTTQSSPESVLIDCGVVELMNYAFGGNTDIGGRTYVAAKRPGMTAVFEKLFKAAAYQKYTGQLSYGGSGILDNGSLLCAEQLLIDMEIAEAFFHLDTIEVRDEPIEDIIAKVAETDNGSFLTEDHTLENYHGIFWNPAIFLRSADETDKSIIASANARFEKTVRSYTEYAYDKAKIRQGLAILARAQEEMGIAVSPGMRAG